MTSQNSRCAIYGIKTGFGTKEFVNNMEVLKENIRQQIENGTTTFITSASEGYELNAAKYILQLKAENRDVHLIIVRPYEGAYVFWRVKPILERVIAGADMVKYVCEQKEDYYAELLDEWIVSHCATILCVTGSQWSFINRIRYFDLSQKAVTCIYDESSRGSDINATSRPIGIGKRWTEEEEAILISEFKEGLSIESIAEHLERNTGGIRARLEKLGLIGTYYSEEYSAEEKSDDNLNNIVIAAEQLPGKAWFDNFDEVKEHIRTGLQIYNSTDYSIDNIAQAREDFKVLKALKKRLTEKKKALRKAYEMPIEVVMSQLDELIEMVKEPYDIIDRMLKENAKELKRRDIMTYAKAQSAVLGEYAGNIIESPAFFNPRWCNATYSRTAWTSDIKGIIVKARETIDYILENGNHHKQVMLGYYFNKLTLDGVDAFLRTVEEAPDYTQPAEVIYVDVESGEFIDAINSVCNDTFGEENENIEDITVSISLTGKPDMIEKFLDTARYFGIKFAKHERIKTDFQ